MYRTSLGLLSYLTLPGTKAVHVAPGLAFQPSVAAITAAVYQAYYLALDLTAGVRPSRTSSPYLYSPNQQLLFLPINALLLLTATSLATNPPPWLPGSEASWTIHQGLPFILSLFTFGWIAQFIGHGVFEGKAPALFDNLVQALVSAPFFVHLEVLFDLFDCKCRLARMAFAFRVRKSWDRMMTLRSSGSAEGYQEWRGTEVEGYEQVQDEVISSGSSRSSSILLRIS